MSNSGKSTSANQYSGLTLLDSKKLFWPNVCAKVLYFVARLVGSLPKARLIGKKESNLHDGVLAIEAGEQAWEHIFFQEAYQSAVEYLGNEHVVRLSVRQGQSYIRQVREFVVAKGVDFYFYDPRTGSQSLVPALMQSFRLLALFARLGIVPVAYCTDISLRRWRLQTVVVTALNGLCVCLTRDDIAKAMYPHERLIGPAIMPLSMTTVMRLEELRREKTSNELLKVSFFGSLYEPRASQLEEIRAGLDAAGISFEVSGRPPGGGRISEAAYWQKIMSSDILVSTSSQIQAKGMDLGHINHLIYRFTEALACGVCLVIEDAPGVEQYFSDSKDLVLWTNTKDAVEKIVSLSGDIERVRGIRERGRQTAIALATSRAFWSEVFNQLDLLQFKVPPKRV